MLPRDPRYWALILGSIAAGYALIIFACILASHA